MSGETDADALSDVTPTAVWVRDRPGSALYRLDPPLDPAAIEPTRFVVVASFSFSNGTLGQLWRSEIFRSNEHGEIRYLAPIRDSIETYGVRRPLQGSCDGHDHSVALAGIGYTLLPSVGDAPGAAS